MKIKITKFEPYQGKSMKGKFSFEFKLEEKKEDGSIRTLHGEVHDCTFWDNGKGKWIVYPEKRKKNTESGNWEHEYCYFGFLEPKDQMNSEIISALEKHLASKSV